MSVAAVCIVANSGEVLQEMYSLLLFVAQVNSTFWLALMFFGEGASTTAPLIPVIHVGSSNIDNNLLFAFTSSKKS